MRTEDLTTPTVPVRYVALVLEATDAHGVRSADLLAAAGISRAHLDDPSARISLVQTAMLLTAAVRLTGQPALGYEMGLNSSLTSHGIMGFGMMTSPTVGDAVRMGVEFLQLRVPVLSAQLRVEGDVAAVEVTETFPLGELRRILFDTFLVKLARLAPSLTGGQVGYDDVELWFDYPEPEYHAAFAEQLPPMRFDMGSNEMRAQARVLDLRLETADPLHAKLVEEQCRRELEQLGLAGDIVGQVRATLRGSDGGYPTLVEVAELLHVSPRTLRRRLQERGTSYAQLLDAARRADAIRLLTTTALSVEQVGTQLGYADARGFRRAFSGWTGTSPSEFREAQRALA